MMNGISSCSSYMSCLQSQGMQQQRGPAGMFDKVDADKSGGISQTELETFAEKISGKTGTTIDTEDALSTYDADESGELSGDELRAFLDASGFQPPQRQGMGGMGMPPGPPPAGMFSDADSDESGGISQTELETLAGNISDKTGTTIDTEDALSVYDTNGDGELSGEELRNFMEASGVQPPRGFMQQAMSAYGMNSGGSQTSTLLDLLTADEETYNPFSLIA